MVDRNKEIAELAFKPFISGTPIPTADEGYGIERVNSNHLRIIVYDKDPKKNRVFLIQVSGRG